MPEWFAPKRFGLGSGLPIAWQGWAVLAVYFATIAASFVLLGEHNPATYAIVAISTAVLLVIAARTTKGNWRWRWGKENQ